MRFILWSLSVGMMAGIAGIGILGWGLFNYAAGLPDYRALANYEPPITSRLYAGDGRLMAEFATEKRVFVPIEAMPRRVIDAFIAAEDQNFATHPGLDVRGIARAMVSNVRNVMEDRRLEGASTITQQVAKNFLLTNEVSIDRKVKEAILAFRIEQTFDKQQILELYLNEIYLGLGSYGVAAAALNYFNKSLDRLSVAEAAYLAGLPKGPNNYHPERRPEAAIARRDYVIGRMLEDGYITQSEADLARAAPLGVTGRGAADRVEAAYFTEEVRRLLVDLYGNEALLTGGLSVRTTLDPRLQAIAEHAVREGLIEYDRRQGWRGPFARLDWFDEWPRQLQELAIPGAAGDWLPAVVLNMDNSAASIGLPDGSRGLLPVSGFGWARPVDAEGDRGPRPERPGDILAVGDVVLVSPQDEDGTYALQQIPAAQGALIALDPHTGRVLAMVGGLSYADSEFNRATQAVRQPGSAFKPFVYLTALQEGFTPSTLILDAPMAIDQGPGLPKWRPSNYSGEFYGATPLRVGLEKSRNLMTVRLAQYVGMERIATLVERFGIVDELPHHLSLSLGAIETTPMRLTVGYAMLANGGKRIEPTLIDRVQDRHGRTLYRHDDRPCRFCGAVGWGDQRTPAPPDTRARIADPRHVYQIVSILEGVVERGTGRRLRDLGRPIAGKTGTTNDNRDTWFMGFTPDLVVGAFVGRDDNQPLGDKETGSATALPVFKSFMAEALEGMPNRPFRVPEGIRLVRVDPETGQPGSDGNAIWEAFIPGTEPTGEAMVLDAGIFSAATGFGDPSSAGARATTGTGGLY